jgi:hypothetical protein
MAYKQNPGRGNNAKTGHGLPSPFKQTEIELTKSYTENKKQLTKNTQEGNTPANLDVNKLTNEAKPTNSAHSVIKGGSFLKEVDSKGNFVREVPIGSREAKTFESDVNKKNLMDKASKEKQAMVWNASSGGTSPSNLTEEQKKFLVSRGKAVKA